MARGLSPSVRRLGRCASAAYQGKPERPDEEFYRALEPFQRVIPAAPADEIKDVTGHTYSFRAAIARSRSALLAYRPQHLVAAPAGEGHHLALLSCRSTGASWA